MTIVRHPTLNLVKDVLPDLVPNWLASGWLSDEPKKPAEKPEPVQAKWDELNAKFKTPKKLPPATEE